MRAEDKEIVMLRNCSMNKKIRVLHQNINFPAYRVPIYCKLASHPLIDFTFIHDTLPGVASGEVGLKNVTDPMPFNVIARPFPRIAFKSKSVIWCSPINELIKREKYDILIHDFKTRYASINRTMKIQQKRGGKFLLWGIGFSQTPTPLLNRIRMRLIDKADATILYSQCDRQRYIRMGADPQKIFIAHNTPGFDKIEKAIAYWTPDKLKEFKREQGLSGFPILLHAGRIAQQKRLDILIRAAEILKCSFGNIKLVLIGDGPYKNVLQGLIRSTNLAENVILPGQITREMDVAPWFLCADLVVAPGQVGLLAMHAPSYGKPLITNDNEALHGPEAQILLHEKTGLKYKYGDFSSLLNSIELLLHDEKLRDAMGKAGFDRVRKQCGVGNMANGILQAISYAVGHNLGLFDSYP